ncbi:MAG: AAA family ATPase [Magnetococcales bacterium]|nr:AAA family ATPase [Magnetococcales bacterium]
MDFSPETHFKPRAWVLGKMLLRGKVSMLVAPPGAGKSMLTLSMAVAIVSGRADILNEPVPHRVPVWMYNNEDDIEELERRLYAIMQHYKVTWDDLSINGKRALFINSGTSRQFVIASKDQKQNKVVAKDSVLICSQIMLNDIGVFIADPLAETHHADENNNSDMAQVGAYYRSIATETGCSVLLVHHSRKSSGKIETGSIDMARGASSMMGVARVAFTLATMTPTEAKNYGISEERRTRHIRLDDAKANLALVSPVPRWLYKQTVHVPNDTGESDAVGVLEPVTLEKQEIEDPLPMDVANVIAGPGEYTINSISEKLRVTNPAYAGKPSNTLKRHIERAFLGGELVKGLLIKTVPADEAGNKKLSLTVSTVQ